MADDRYPKVIRICGHDINIEFSENPVWQVDGHLGHYNIEKTLIAVKKRNG